MGGQPVGVEQVREAVLDVARYDVFGLGAAHRGLVATLIEPLQIVASKTLANYDSEVRRLTTGCSVVVTGTLVAYEGKRPFFVTLLSVGRTLETAKPADAPANQAPLVQEQISELQAAASQNAAHAATFHASGLDQTDDSPRLVGQTTRNIGLVVREAPNEGIPSFGSNH